METALEALPGRPLAAEDVAALNDAAKLRLVPYTWFGEQVIAALLLYDDRTGEEENDAEPTTESEQSDGKESPFGGRDDAIGTVEVIDEGGVSADEPADEPVEPADESGDDLSVFAVGYDDDAGAWVVVAEIDPDAEFTDAEAPIREWLNATYHEAIVERIAVGPSEYGQDHGRSG